MWTIEVLREDYNLFNGRKLELNSLFFVQHQRVKVASKMFDILANNHAFEGGDKVVYRQNNKVKKQFLLCNICCKAPAKRRHIRCKGCDKSIAKVMQSVTTNKPKETENKNLKYYKY